MVMNQVKEKYISLLEEVMNDIGIHSVDDDLERCELFFGKSKSFAKVNEKSILNSDYIHILNEFYTDVLNEEELAEMSSLSSIDEKNLFIHKTLHKVLCHGSFPTIVLNPASEGRSIVNGNLALEIVIGNNTVNLLDNEKFISNLQKQEEFLIQLIHKYTQLLTIQMNYPITIFYVRVV